MVIRLDLKEDSYDIYVERGALDSIGDYIDLRRKVMIVTDSGVPRGFSEMVASSSEDPVILTIDMGERNKNFDSYRLILRAMVENDFTRSDCIVAVGGGMTGDLAGFAAATYLRGVDFYNVPTTLLSQIDSSIGGKVAIDFYGYKNLAGAFYQPKAVIVDPDVLSSLPERQISSGLAEAVKTGLALDADLFSLIEKGDIEKEMDEIIIRCLGIKKRIVEEDEKEKGLRKVLNFGHTLGHGIETASEGRRLHGECVALGMTYMTGGEARERLLPVLRKCGLPVEADMDSEVVMDAVAHDKKFRGDRATVIKVDVPGSFRMEEMTLADIGRILEEGR